MSPPVIPPAGVSLAGFFLPVLYENPGAPPGILADAIDPATGDYLSIERGFDPTDAAVLTALTVKRGSGSAVTDVGQRYQDLERVDDTAEQFISAETERALRRLVESRQVAFERVTPVIGDDWAEVQVIYRNLPRGQRRDPQLPLGRTA
jgi:hypothetical protein